MQGSGDLVAATRRKQRLAAQTRKKREKMRAAGICVNGWSHGPAVKGGRCQSCWDKKKAGEGRRSEETV